MSSIGNALMGWRRFLRRLCKWGRSESKTDTKKRSRFRPALEELERREVPAALTIGMNVEEPTDYSPAWTFTDAFTSSRSWLSLEYNTVTRLQTNSTMAVSVDEHGWPTELASRTDDQGQLVEQRLATTMFIGNESANPYAAGIYYAQWEGEGVVTWGRDARVIEQGTTEDGLHFARLDVTPSRNGIYMQINSMEESDPIRDVHVWMPDYNGQSFVGQDWTPGADFSPFHPLFLERLEPFDTIRFMQWDDIPGSDVVTWDQRREVSDARQQTYAGDFRNGVALEYMIELSNELDANAWFNMPHLADDNYVTQYATMVRDTLDPNLTVYVEWSDEPWNWAGPYEAHWWINDQLDLPENAGMTFEQIWAREMERDFNIWSQVFAGQEERLVRVLAGSPSSWQTNQVALNMHGNFDAIAIAPYLSLFADQRPGLNETTTPDQVLDMIENVSLPRAMMSVDNHRALADQYSAQLGRDISLVAYEGGLDLLPLPNASYNRALYDASLSPRVYDILTVYLEGLTEHGLEMMVHYEYTGRAGYQGYLQSGDAGALHTQDEPLASAHRYRALVDYLANTTQPTVTIAASDSSAAEAGLDGALFTFTRSGDDLSQPLAINYAVSGSAVAGNDFEPLTGSVSFAPGEASVTIALSALDDLEVEEDETVILTLLEDPAYLLEDAVSATATITSDDVPNQAPVNTVPGAQNAVRDGALVFSTANGNAITVSDPDAGQGHLQVTLTATNGTLSLAAANDLTAVSGDGTSTVVMTGTIAQVNAALDGLAFTPSTGFSGPAVLQLTTDDLGNGGVGGPLTDTDTVAIQVIAPATVQSVVINDGQAQRSMITSVTITFSGPVQIDAGAFSLVRSDGWRSHAVAVNYTPGVYSSLTLTFAGNLVERSGSLTNGAYTLVIRGERIHETVFGQALDGDGNGSAGGNQRHRFHRLFGDSDGNGRLERGDWLSFWQSYGSAQGDTGYLWYFDWDQDGHIDRRDAARVCPRPGRPIRLS